MLPFSFIVVLLVFLSFPANHAPALALSTRDISGLDINLDGLSFSSLEDPVLSIADGYDGMFLEGSLAASRIEEQQSTVIENLLRSSKFDTSLASSSEAMFEEVKKNIRDEMLSAFSAADAISINSTSSISFPTSFSCQAMPAKYTPYMFCSGVVDYSVFIPSTSSLKALDKQASSLANYYPASILSAKCLSEVKRDICSIIMRPCVPKGKRLLLLFSFSFSYFSDSLSVDLSFLLVSCSW
jgi:hypothetical protein